MTDSLTLYADLIYLRTCIIAELDSSPDHPETVRLLEESGELITAVHVEPDTTYTPATEWERPDMPTCRMGR